MAVSDTIQLLEPFIEADEGPAGLSSLFKVPVGGIHNKTKVEFHVMRTSRKIALPVRDPSVGYRKNSLKSFTIKEIVPTVYKEALTIGADEVMQGRTIGKTIYENPAIMEQIRTKVAPTVMELQQMIKLAIELYGSQVLLSATVSLSDENGVVFTEDFGPRTTHFPNASVAWTTTGSAVPFTDMADHYDVISTNGKKRVMRSIMNSKCFDDMKNTDQFKAGASSSYSGEIYRLDDSRDPIHPRLPADFIFKGVLKVRGHETDLYTYDGYYDDPSTGAATKYVPDNKMISEAGPRLDATFGKLNKFGINQEAARLVQGGRMADPNKLADLSYNMWFSEDYEVFNFGVGTRVALGPITIDRFGTLTTKGF